MYLNQITLPALGVERSVAFYLGLRLKLIVSAFPRYARFECPNGYATFSVHHVEEISNSPAVVVYFECENLDDKVLDLKVNVYLFMQEPKDENWLWREARLADPSGNISCLYFAGESRRNPPWRISP